ncbi:MAG: NAD(P)H-dependent flavin oxidoreductase [Pseudomonadota bacterium]
MPIPAVLEGRLSLPVIGSPLFIVSGPDLVIAQCKAGIVGSFPSLNARPSHVLDEWLTRIETELAAFQAANPGAKVAPYAVNLIVHVSNNRLEEDIAICAKHKVPIIITSLRAPAAVVEAVHGWGGIVLHDVINIRHAKKALGEGVDGLILVCAGAGGHAGTLNPFALVSEVRQFWEGPIALSGAIANGASILGAQAMGADLAYIGTRFIATEEANAMPAYKQALVDASAKDIVYSSLFTGVHGNYLAPSIRAAGLDPDNLPSADKSTMDFGSGGNTDAKAWKDIWGAGQGTGSIQAVLPAGEVVARLRKEYAEAQDRMMKVAF